MNKKSYHNFFINLSNKTKFDIIMALKEKPLSVNEIIEKTGGEQSKISHNLKSLKTCHIVKMKKEGKKRIYRLNEKSILPILDIVKKHVRKNCPCGCEKCEID
jgi:DNA-binding transcriptional ArsR family regulator